MLQPEVQVPALHTSPDGQLAGPLTFVHEDVLDAGAQTSHPLFASAPAP
jgi:hypothetical protein